MLSTEQMLALIFTMAVIVVLIVIIAYKLLSPDL